MTRLLTALALLWPLAATAQPPPPRGPQLAIILGNVADAMSTELVLAHGAGREANSVLATSPAPRLAIKAASTGVQVWAVRRLSTRHPRAAKVVGYALGAVAGGVAAWNVSVLLRAPHPQPRTRTLTPLDVTWPQPIAGARP